jgi:hypothetical protein
MQEDAPTPIPQLVIMERRSFVAFRTRPKKYAIVMIGQPASTMRVTNDQAKSLVHLTAQQLDQQAQTIGNPARFQ